MHVKEEGGGGVQPHVQVRVPSACAVHNDVLQRRLVVRALCVRHGRAQEGLPRLVVRCQEVVHRVARRQIRARVRVARVRARQAALVLRVATVVSCIATRPRPALGTDEHTGATAAGRPKHVRDRTRSGADDWPNHQLKCDGKLRPKPAMTIGRPCLAADSPSSHGSCTLVAKVATIGLLALKPRLWRNFATQASSVS
eukprot:scaffold98814_cov73-Phaeocystis_antarctica.AAC.14